MVSHHEQVRSRRTLPLEDRHHLTGAPTLQVQLQRQVPRLDAADGEDLLDGQSKKLPDHLHARRGDGDQVPVVGGRHDHDPDVDGSPQSALLQLLLDGRGQTGQVGHDSGAGCCLIPAFPGAFIA